MQIRVSLNNKGGELDAKTIPDMDDAIELSCAIEEVIGDWTLGAGDIIKIEEVD